MTEQLRFGGLRFDITIPASLKLIRLDTVYDAFTALPQSEAPAPTIIPVTIHDTPYQPPGELSLCFDGESWKLFKCPGHRVIVAPGAHPSAESYWIAQLSDDLSHVDIWIGDHFRPHADPNSPYHINPLVYPLDQILAFHLLTANAGVLIHCAGVILNGKAIICPGISGAGKSTLAKRFIEAGLEDRILSDDRVILRRHHNQWVAYGTPWPGEARIARPIHAPLGAIAFLQQANRDALTPISPSAALRHLLPVTSLPLYDPTLAQQALETCGALLEATPSYTFDFTPTPSAAATLVAAFTPH